MLPLELVGRTDWWTGPEWLAKGEPDNIEPEPDITHLCMAEERVVQFLSATTESTLEPKIIWTITAP